MKLLLVSPFTSTSGSAIRFWHIARHLARRGHRVVYAERRPQGEPPPPFQSVEYHSTPKLPNLYLDIVLSLTANLLLLARHFDCTIYYALKPAPNNGIPALVAKLMRKRVFLDIDDLDYGYFPPGLRRRLSKLFFDALPRHFELVTCHTQKLREYITGRLGIPDERVFVLRQGISDVFLSYDLSGRSAEVAKSIVYAATLGITSDFGDMLPMLADVCTSHPDLIINVIGDGVRRGEFERKADEMGIRGNIRFHGRVPHQRLPEVMADNWIGINYMRPSLTNDCRAILKIREYLALGLQVVCNDVGDAGEFHDYAYVEPDLESMSGRLVTLLKGRMNANRAGRRFVKNEYRWEELISGFMAWARIDGVLSA